VVLAVSNFHKFLFVVWIYWCAVLVLRQHGTTVVHRLCRRKMHLDQIPYNRMRCCVLGTDAYFLTTRLSGNNLWGVQNIQARLLFSQFRRKQS
jgi:hypothetical protein